MRRIYYAIFVVCFLKCSSGYQVGHKPRLTWGRPPHVASQPDDQISRPLQNAFDGSQAENILKESFNSNLEIGSIKRNMGKYLHLLGRGSGSRKINVLQFLPQLARTEDKRNVGRFMYLLDRKSGAKKRNEGKYMHLMNAGKRNVGRYMHLLNKKSDNAILTKYPTAQHTNMNNIHDFDESSDSERYGNARDISDDPYKRNYNMRLYYQPPKGMVVDYIGSGIFRRQLEQLVPLVASHVRRGITQQFPGQGLLSKETNVRRDRKTLAQVLRQISNGGRTLDMSHKQARVALKQIIPGLGNLNSFNQFLPGTQVPLVQRLQGLRQGKLYNQALKAKILKTYRKYQNGPFL